MPFRTKICGITNVPDAECLATAGVDAIGLNFFEKSKRFVEVGEAAIIAAALPPEVLRVGVFVNASIESIRDTVERVGLDFVQLHGDEPPEFLTELTDVRVIRAFRCRDGLDEVGEYLARCQHKPHTVLLDAYDPDEYGGTGKQLHWPDLRNAAAVIGTLPLILAGGLTPSNVARAIAEAQPYGVDTASGVESGDARRKDPQLARAFVDAAKAAFDALN